MCKDQKLHLGNFQHIFEFALLLLLHVYILMEHEFEKAPFLLKLMSICIGSAEKAGKLINSVIAKGELKTVNKASFGETVDPQTEADRLSQLCIVGKLKQCFPALIVIGEEGDLKETLPSHYLDEITPNEEVLKVKCPFELYHFDESSLIVWVDPLDGTKSFTKGIYHQVVISIGVATLKGIPIAGVLHQLYNSNIPIEYDHLSVDYSKSKCRNVWGIVDVGVFGLECRDKFRNGNMVVLTSKSHSIENDHETAVALDADLILKTSGAAYKSLCVLENEADVLLYCLGGTKKWDICAVDAFFRALGGRLTDRYGNDYNYAPTASHDNKYGVVACLKNHDVIINKIKAYLSKK